MSTLTLLVTYTALPGQRDNFLREVDESGLPERVRREGGCLKYDYYRSVDNENQILLVERWSSAAAQTVHLAKPHMLALVSLKKKYISGTDVIKLSEPKEK